MDRAFVHSVEHIFGTHNHTITQTLTCVNFTFE